MSNESNLVMAVKHEIGNYMEKHNNNSSNKKKYHFNNFIICDLSGKQWKGKSEKRDYHGKQGVNLIHRT